MKLPIWLVLAISLAATSAMAATGHEQHRAASASSQDQIAPGWQPLAFPAPEPGTYELPPLGPARDGDVLDLAGSPRKLHEVYADDVVVLSFIYTACPDPNGCPLANYVLAGVHRRILDAPSLRGRVRLVSLSFDPAHDTPHTLGEYAAGLAGDGAAWTFLTTSSDTELAPILSAYGQSVQKEYDENGKPLGTIAHLLRVFLIDREKRIRNVYSSSFLHADTLWSDIQTLLAEEEQEAPRVDAAVAKPAALQPVLAQPGDDKRGYEGAGYETRSRSLVRSGEPADLIRFHREPGLGLPPAATPADNPLTPARVALGRKLFFDRRLSPNGTISCAMCHVPEQGFTSNEIATAVGIEGQTVRRNAATIYNAAYAELLFHDGRESRLEGQVWTPLLASNEMGNHSADAVIEKLRSLPDYAGLFEAAFEGRGPTVDTVGMAIAAYERTLLSANSPFDRWHFGKEKDALSPAGERGFRLFTGRAGCSGCHAIERDHALFTDQKLHNTGIGHRQAAARPATAPSLQVGPGEHIRIDPKVLAYASEPPQSDLGRYEVTGNDEDRWKYKTPSLRNVALTAPYMHDGSLATLREVVEYYDQGGAPHPLLDPGLRPLRLSDAEKADLVVLLESLTGDNVDVIVRDAFAAPIGDPG